MCVTEAKLTVYFDDPFWVGVFERRQGNRLEAARVVFGAEPKDYDVYGVVLAHYQDLRFGVCVTLDNPAREPAAASPKRRQRDAAQALAQTGVGTKAQQALKQQREVGKVARKAANRQEREAEQARKFALKQAKRRQKHLGH